MHSYEDQKAALELLVKKDPHNIEAFRRLYNVNSTSTVRPEVDRDEILGSTEWSVEEKIQLLKLYEHDVTSIWLSYEGYVDYSIDTKSLTGLEAVLKMGAVITSHSFGRIINNITNKDERYKFFKMIIKYYNKRSECKRYQPNKGFINVPSLADRFPGRRGGTFGRDYIPICPMEEICATKDRKLIGLFLSIIKDVNNAMPFAILTGDTKIVQMFLDKGADINYQDTEFKTDNHIEICKTPIKMAIDRDDLKMVKYLKEHGADLDYVDHSDRMKELIDMLGDSYKYPAQYGNTTNSSARMDYFTWAYTPLQYAINTNYSSICRYGINAFPYLDIERPDITTKLDEFKKRAKIVKYLYDNGATFGNGEINYTDLICFAIRTESFDLTRYFFKEAEKNNYDLDIPKIVSYIHHPGNIRVSYTTTWYIPGNYEDIKVWFDLCEEWSRNHYVEKQQTNYKAILNRILDFTCNEYQVKHYKEQIKRLFDSLDENVRNDITAVLKVPEEFINDMVEIGFNIYVRDEDGENLLIKAIDNKDIIKVNELLSQGFDPNERDSSGNCALSHLFEILSESWEDVAINMIDKCSIDTVRSKEVEASFYKTVSPVYGLILFNKMIEALYKKGFLLSEEFVKQSVGFAKPACGGKENIEWKQMDPITYLEKLYGYSKSSYLGTKVTFPVLKKLEYGTEESKEYFRLIREHFYRNFVTSKSQVKDADETKEYDLNFPSGIMVELSNYQVAIGPSLAEVRKFIGYLDYRQVITLLDDIKDVTAKDLNDLKLLFTAIKMGDLELSKELIKRGASIVAYDENGHDITTQVYDKEIVDTFMSLNPEYTPVGPYQDLLTEIGCGQLVPLLTKKDNA